jgi:hypothetical protein
VDKKKVSKGDREIDGNIYVNAGFNFPIAERYRCDSATKIDEPNFLHATCVGWRNEEQQRRTTVFAETSLF